MTPVNITSQFKTCGTEVFCATVAENKADTAVTTVISLLPEALFL